MNDNGNGKSKKYTAILKIVVFNYFTIAGGVKLGLITEYIPVLCK